MSPRSFSTSHSPYTLQSVSIPPPKKNAPCHGGIWTHLIYGSFCANGISIGQAIFAQHADRQDTQTMQHTTCIAEGASMHYLQRNQHIRGFGDINSRFTLHYTEQ